MCGPSSSSTRSPITRCTTRAIRASAAGHARSLSRTAKTNGQAAGRARSRRNAACTSSSTRMEAVFEIAKGFLDFVSRFAPERLKKPGFREKAGLLLMSLAIPETKAIYQEEHEGLRQS